MKRRCRSVWPLLVLVPVLCLATGIPAVADDKKIPDHFDWRTKKIMTPVKSQGKCGSCGEFAAIAVLEALIKKETGKEVDLSEQQIVSCVPGCGCKTGCSSLAAMKYLQQNGVVPEAEYPYAGKDTTCKSGLRGKYFLAEVHSTEIDKKSLAQRIKTIKETILTYGPVATNMGFYDDLDRYKSGVYTYDGKAACQGGHWVTLVGWADDLELPSGGYWICRNSWGAKWGEEGYFKSAYGDKTGIDDYYIVYGTFAPDTNSQAK